MALSEMELSIGTRRSLQEQETQVVTKKKEPSRLYTQQEITNMMLETPPSLTSERPVETPVGIWHMEGGITIFDSKPSEEIEKITRPTVKTKIFNFVKAASRMY